MDKPQQEGQSPYGVDHAKERRIFWVIGLILAVGLVIGFLLLVAAFLLDAQMRRQQRDSYFLELPPGRRALLAARPEYAPLHDGRHFGDIEVGCHVAQR